MILEPLGLGAAYHSRRRMFLPLTLVAAGAFIAPRVNAQTEQESKFEVASVKADKTTGMRNATLEMLPGGRFIARNIPLYIIIATAYNVPFQSSSEVRLAGAPQWVREERFDIEATPPPGAIAPGASSLEREEKIRSMVRSLLADRFQLAVRTDRRDIPVYEIRVAKNGPKLERSDVPEKDCSEAAIQPPCHRFSGGQGRGLHAKAVNISDVALYVSNWTDRPVVDKTGLKDLFRIETEGWSPMHPVMVPPGMEPSPEQRAMADPSRPTIFMIFDRIGLKLEPAKDNLETYTVEHVERPAEN